VAFEGFIPCDHYGIYLSEYVLIHLSNHFHPIVITLYDSSLKMDFFLLQDNVSRGKVGAMILLELFQEAGRLQFIYVGSGYLKVVSLP